MTLQTLRLGVSATVFLGLLAWMQAGPVVTQVFGKKLLFGTMAWQMYHGKGIQQCVVRWSDGATGEEVESPPLQPRRRKHYTNEKEVLREARSRCKDGVDLRATVWCGRRPEGHWKELLTDERVLCP